MRQNERSISFNVDAYTARLIKMENVSRLEGAKGIGRFAFDRISDRCEMLTISE